MRALLDVNVLIALLDPDHVHHQPAMHWFEANLKHGWASCPITQNGCVRILSQPKYPNPFPTAQVAERLAEATSTQHHEFWPDSVSLLDNGGVNRSMLLNPRHVTDVYLLSLAVVRQGRFVTFDRAVPLAAVVGARPEHLHTL